MMKIRKLSAFAVSLALRSPLDKLAVAAN